ncbi:hypothetical protein L7F22_012539 [Adiantum nelumboides]|nr:hypothetical protein [Adiantum nelumboides]
MTKEKIRQRLGSAGGSITLPAFVNAKSKPRFNPAVLRKKSKQFENAKTIKKYKKLANCLPNEEGFSGVPVTEQKVTHVSKRYGPTKGKNVIEALRKDFVEKKEEKDRLRAERLEALKIKEEARAKALQVRKNLKAKMFKRTSSGQPLMKHRVQHILDSIQQHQ